MIPGLIREATPDEVARFRGADYTVPEGYVAALADEFVRGRGLEWRPVTPLERAQKRCRFLEARVGCKAQPVVACLRRGTRDFFYCERHLYGREFVPGHDGAPDRMLTVTIYERGRG